MKTNEQLMKYDFSIAVNGKNILSAFNENQPPFDTFSDERAQQLLFERAMEEETFREVVNKEGSTPWKKRECASFFYYEKTWGDCSDGNLYSARLFLKNMSQNKTVEGSLLKEASTNSVCGYYDFTLQYENTDEGRGKREKVISTIETLLEMFKENNFIISSSINLDDEERMNAD